MNSHEDIEAKFVADRHMEGSVIPNSYFWELFGLPEPRGVMAVHEAKKTHLAFAGAMSRLKEKLLKEHQLDLQSVHSKGYALVPWADRIETAWSDTRRALKKSISRGRDRLTFLPNPEQLNYDQRRERDSALLSLDMARKLISARKKYPIGD